MYIKLTTIALGIFGILVGLAAVPPALADDTEIFMTQFSGTGVSGGRPKVLILFDNSGSMRNGVEHSKPDYDVAIDWTDGNLYPGAPTNFRADRIYWSFDGNPPSRTTDRYVPVVSNQCNTSIMPLNQTGRYTDYLRVWREGQGLIGTEESTECECQYRTREESCDRVCVRFKNNGKCREYEDTCSWDGWSDWNRSNYQISEYDCTHRGLDNDGLEYQWACSTVERDIYGDIDIWRSVEDNDDTRQTSHLECAADVDQDDIVNPNTDDGWASDESGPFRAGSPGDPWDTWNKRHDSDLTRTLFTGNYLAWYYNDDLIENRTKMEIAQDVVTELVANNPQIDFGMMLFNWNDSNGRNGGRVVKHLSRMDLSDRDGLVALVDSLEPETWTPLCETYYEAYRYIAKPNNSHSRSSTATTTGTGFQAGIHVRKATADPALARATVATIPHSGIVKTSMSW